MKGLPTVLAASLFLAIACPLSASAAPHDFTVTNSTPDSIEYVQISPPSNTKWGDDWLNADEMLGSGESRTFSITQGCEEDIRVTWMDQHSREWRDFDTCQYDLRVDSETSSASSS